MNETLAELAARLQLNLTVAPPPKALENFHRNTVERGGPPMTFLPAAVLTLPSPDPNHPSEISQTAFALTSVCRWAMDRGWTVRAVGSRWSFSAVTVPGRDFATSDNLLIETSAFRVHWQLAADPHCFYLTSGCELHGINEALEKRGFAVKTSGSSDGQTIAGAIGTGVHGSGFKTGALHDTVRAFHLATPEGDLLVGRSDVSFPKALRDEVQGMFSIQDVRIDANLFDALCVSFGSFGVLVGVVLEVEELQAIRVIRRSLPAAKLADLIRVIETDGDFGSVDPALKAEQPTDDAHHCQVLINPNDSTTYKVVLMYRRKNYVPPKPFAWPDVFNPSEPCILSMAWPFIEHADWAFAPLVGGKFNGLTDINAWGVRSQIFGKPEQPLPVHSIGIGIPLDRTVEAVNIAHAVAQQEKFPGASELRFVKASPAHLAVNRFAPITAVLGFDGLDNIDSWEFTGLLLQKLRQAQIPYALHWGKMNDFGPDPVANKAALAAMYGPSLTAWQAARKALLGHATSVFDNVAIRRLGIG